MENTLSIFVSGTGNQSEHRLRLKALVNNLNGEYDMKGVPVNLAMFSSDDLGDDPLSGEAFIRNQADIVIFLLEDRIGEQARKEFLLASEALRKNGRPKVYVFLREFQERTPEIAEIESLVNASLDSYYVDYSNLEDLETKVTERLRHEVSLFLGKTKDSPAGKLRVFKAWAWAATLLLLSFAAAVFFLYRSDQRKVTLLFAGGSSAANCIRDNYKRVGNIYQYENAVCMGIPSSLSWSLITTDVLHHFAVRGERVSHPVYPVSVSAVEATEEDFLEMCSVQQFISKGAVLSFYLGEDQLVLYTKKGMLASLQCGKDSLYIKDLADYLHQPDEGLTIFSTREGSGTLLSYRSALKPYDVDVSTQSMGDILEWFTESTPGSKVRKEGQPYMIMGSTCYYVRETVGESDALLLLDESGKSISKPIYLYFAGYASQDGTALWIPDEMVEFLIKLDSRFENAIRDNLILRENEKVIVSLNDYLKD